jgi:hypothetical protein
LLLIVDEAHTLPLRLLEEVRLLTNIVRHGQPRVRLVLAGAAKLEERLASPKLESFNQRIAVRSYLQSFNYDETLAFVKSAIGSAGGKWEAIFTPDALDAVYRATDGIPRLVNQVCDHALMLAYVGGVRRLDKSGIEEAWADLQQLPTPWNAADGAPEAAPDIIEFGALDDEEVRSRDKSAPQATPRLVAVAADAHEQAEASELFTGEPADRLEKIGDELEKLNDDYRPLGKTGPEVELVFPTVDPFAEAFAEEEVVIDRIAAMQRDPLAGRPLVRSVEGHEIAVLMPPPAKSATLPLPIGEGPPAVSLSNKGEVVSAVEGQSDAPLNTGESSEDFERQIATPVFVAAYDPVMPEPASDHDEVEDEDDNQPSSRIAMMRDMPAPLAEVERPHSAGFDPQAGWPPAGSGAAAVAAGLHGDDAPTDDDILLIEDDPQEPAPSSPPPSPVRRQEYKGLFARLRRS